MAAVEQVQTHANILWTLLAACLVLWMQAGFAFVESGFTRAKNAAHIMMKNVLDMSMGALSFWLIGFGIMFGATNGLFGTDRFLLSPDNGAGDGQWEYTFWMFQVVFAATAATIVSGAMAERTRFAAYLIYSVAITAIIYPVFGHWAWGKPAAGPAVVAGRSGLHRLRRLHRGPLGWRLGGPGGRDRGRPAPGQVCP